jgi:hypothetical protein
MMHTERRQHRSNDRVEAAQLFLGAVARRARLDAVALSTEDGLLVAGVGDADHELLAAHGCLQAAGRPSPDQAEVTGGEPLHAYPIVLRGAILYLSSLGGSFEPGDDVQRALARILTS